MKARPVMIGAAVAGAFFVGGAAVATVSDQQPQTIAPIEQTQIAVASSLPDVASTVNSTPVTVEPSVEESGPSPVSTPPMAATGVYQTGIVPGLTERSGVLRLSGDDFYFDRLEVDFGPENWLKRTTAAADLDGDGNTGSWWNEVVGLVGRNVTVLGDLDDDDVDVFQVNGTTLRPFDRPAPWSGGRDDDEYDSDDESLPAVTAISMDAATRIALEQVPGVVYAVELDSDDGVVYWEIEVRATDGSLYDIEIDAESGRVIDVDRD